MNESMYVADPLNPTDEELAAAIQRGLANGTLIDAADWMAAHAVEVKPHVMVTWANAISAHGPETECFGSRDEALAAAGDGRRSGTTHG